MLASDFSAPADRNKQPILDVLRALLPVRGKALEIASGTGQHVEWFAQQLPTWIWQPTDAPGAPLNSIRARVSNGALTNVRAPLHLDVTAQPWFEPAQMFDLIYNANMLHISPWATCTGLMRGASNHLMPNGMLVTYGPYLEDDVSTAEGNLDFDASLRTRNAEWGIRRREDVQAVAKQFGLALSARHAMPANNLLLVWTRTPALD